MSSSTLERIAEALDWCEEHKRLEEREKQKNRWEMELDGLMFTNHPGNILNRARDMSPDVARYEHNNTVETMMRTLDSLDRARGELIRAIELMKGTK